MKKLLLILILFNFNNSFAKTNKDIVINEVKSYLKNLQSIAIDFTQVNPDDNKFYGKFLLIKPYNFRCNYYPPYPLLITSGKNFISVYDYEMQQISHIPAKENLLTFILAGDDNIEKYFNIIDAYEENNKLILILITKDDERRAHIEINKNPYKINKIELVDINGDITSILFDKIVNVKSFDKSLFTIKNPQISGAPPQLSKEQIEKKYK